MGHRKYLNLKTCMPKSSVISTSRFVSPLVLYFIVESPTKAMNGAFPSVSLNLASLFLFSKGLLKTTIGMSPERLITHFAPIVGLTMMFDPASSICLKLMMWLVAIRN